MVGTRVYIGGLPYGAREKDLERFFKGYGRIRDVLLKNGYGFVEFEDYRDADDAVYELNGKELLGERVSVEQARGSARERDGYRSRSSYSSRSRFGNNERRWGRSGVERYGPPTRTEFRLIVENLSSRVSWQDLKDYMRQAGEVTYADAHKQRRNEGQTVSPSEGSSVGHGERNSRRQPSGTEPTRGGGASGVVEFATYQDMRNALDKLDDTDLNGRRIRLIEDTRRKSRRSRSSSSRSRSRSRSRGRRSRSRSRSKSRSKSRERERSRSKSRSRSRSAGKKAGGRPRRSKSPRDKSPKRDSRSRSKSRSRSADRKEKDTDNDKGSSPGANHSNGDDGGRDRDRRSASPEAKENSVSPPGGRSDDESDDGRKDGSGDDD
ncbi:serine/arginine-rich splicing factor 5 isoform X3 [Neocloeon triangulifer]|uniref:serine/arginine-rich splicing factor 5 isoform X3 n=1 Tax=Neocloeon triangulifer TaxID=2078957 RepID=UPI00286F2321|nr:serine/arginine-rich splicing factor 5 isoform X3 [Neocloeon triangulifer]